MERFLTKEIEKKFEKISLDYTFSSPLLINGVLQSQLSSRSTYNHYRILKNWFEEGMIPYDEIAYFCVQDEDIFFALKRMAQLNDMIVHLSTYTDAGFNIFYLPVVLAEYQKLRLRLWIEFMESHCLKWSIDQSTKDTFVYYKTEEEITSCLEKEQILDDAYIRELTKKYPSYKE